MIYVLPTYCGSDYGDDNVPGFATVDIGSGQARYYLKMMDDAARLKLRYPRLLSIQSFDRLPWWRNYPDRWYDEDYPDPDHIVDAIEGEQVIMFDMMPDLGDAEEVHVETVVIETCGGEISWRGYVKYSNIEVSTMALSRAQIEEAL